MPPPRRASRKPRVGDFCIDIGRNICHGSDTVENAEKEIALWFPEGTNAWTSHSQSWIYE